MVGPLYSLKAPPLTQILVTYMHVRWSPVGHRCHVFAGRYWEMVQRLKVTHFYGAPTALRLLLKAGDNWVTEFDRSSLRILGSGRSGA